MLFFSDGVPVYKDMLTRVLQQGCPAPLAPVIPVVLRWRNWTGAFQAGRVLTLQPAAGVYQTSVAELTGEKNCSGVRLVELIFEKMRLEHLNQVLEKKKLLMRAMSTIFCLRIAAE